MKVTWKIEVEMETEGVSLGQARELGNMVSSLETTLRNTGVYADVKATHTLQLCLEDSPTVESKTAPVGDWCRLDRLVGQVSDPLAFS